MKYWPGVLSGIALLTALGILLWEGQKRSPAENTAPAGTAVESKKIEGVVNARTVPIRTAIAGKLSFVKPTAHGTYFAANEPIARVTDDAPDRRHLQDLQAEQAIQRSRIEAGKNRLKKLEALQEDLNASREKYMTYSRVKYEKMLKQTESRVAAERAEYQRAKLEYEANQTLIRENVIPRRDWETTEAAFQKSKARLLELENAESELRNHLDAVRNGVFISDSNDVPYSGQRLHQLTMEISAAETTLFESEHRLTAVTEQIRLEQEKLKRNAGFTASMPFASLAWRLPEAPGCTVPDNSVILVLLECATVFLDVTVPETLFAKLTPGRDVLYRLRGETELRKGVVFAMFATDSDPAYYELAVNRNSFADRDRVWVRVDPESFGGTPENFWKVGRMVDFLTPQ